MLPLSTNWKAGRKKFAAASVNHTYAVLAPTEVTYASAKVRSGDMVKGQAFITAAYALGCSAGNFAGGQLLRLGVKQMLLGGIVMALLGCVILFATVNRKAGKRPS